MRTPGPRTLASVFAVVSHFPSKGSRRLSSGEGKGAPNTLVCSSVIGPPPSTNLEEQPGEAWRPVEQTLRFIEIETPWRPAPLVPSLSCRRPCLLRLLSRVICLIQHHARC